MEYACFKGFKGILLTRKPEIVDEELLLSFSGAPINATAIFENESGNTLYRLLSDGACSIPSDFLRGEIKVTIAVLDGKSNEKYRCESIYGETKNGVVLVYPNTLDVSQQIIEIFQKIQGIEESAGELSRKYTALSEKVECLLDGYDFD